jgi:D-alanyl-D-alanine carboxypeptidase
MLMAGYMRWVHKQSFAFLFAVIVPLLIGVGIVAVPTSEDVQVAPVITAGNLRSIVCFDIESRITLAVSDAVCPPEYAYVGDGPLVEITDSNGEAEALHPLLTARFSVAQSFARADGVELLLTSGFRSLARQQMLFEREVAIRGSESEAAKWVLPPDSSNHPRGLAIDVNYPNGRAEALWLERNGYRFGLCRVYANEWWHFEGVIAPGQACPEPAPSALIDLE